jgi:hypothetical protein
MTERDPLSGYQPGDIHLNEPWLSIVWDRDYGCVYAKFKAFANSGELRAGSMKIVEAIRDRHSASLIIDNRKLEGVVNEDQLWIRDTWTPLAVAAGLKSIAVVLARRGLGKIASEEILGQVGMKVFATRTFDSLDEAMKWVIVAEKQATEHPR